MSHGGYSVEFLLMLGYAVFLALAAILLEWTARHAHRRSHKSAAAGFTYNAERDIWRCPRDEHLFPVLSDSLKGVVIYQAPASACNSCRSKAACTDSNEGRAIERKTTPALEVGLQRFHRAISLTLFVLASLILTVELFRADGRSARLVLISVLAALLLTGLRLAADLFGASDPAEQRSDWLSLPKTR
jgi:heme A synthase